MADNNKGTFASIISWVKIPFASIVFILCASSAFVLFANDDLLARLYMLDIKDQYGDWIGTVFLITALLLLLIVSKNIYTKLRAVLIDRSFARKKLRNLNHYEMAVVNYVYSGKGHCAELNANNPVISGLVAKGILYFGGKQLVGFDIMNNTIPAMFTLQPYVINELDKERDRNQFTVDKLDRRIRRCKNPKKRQDLINQRNDIVTYVNNQAGRV